MCGGEHATVQENELLFSKCRILLLSLGNVCKIPNPQFNLKHNLCEGNQTIFNMLLLAELRLCTQNFWHIYTLI